MPQNVTFTLTLETVTEKWTANGSFTPPPGTTPAEWREAMREQMLAQTPEIPDHATVTHWSFTT